MHWDPVAPVEELLRQEDALLRRPAIRACRGRHEMDPPVGANPPPIQTRPTQAADGGAGNAMKAVLGGEACLWSGTGG